MLAKQITVALCAGLLGLSACAHGEKTRERGSVSAVTNEEVDKHAGEHEQHRMHYTEVSPEVALGHTRRNEEEAAQNAAARREERAAESASADAQACELAVYFASDSAQLDVSSRQRLDRVAECIKRHEIDHATVVGSTDPSGTAEHNRALALERARVVADYLRARGVPERELRVRSQGELAEAGARQDWPMERRAGVEVTK